MKVDDDSLRPLPLPTSRETDLETALRQRDAFVFEQTREIQQLRRHLTERTSQASVDPTDAVPLPASIVSLLLPHIGATGGSLNTSGSGSGVDMGSGSSGSTVHAAQMHRIRLLQEENDELYGMLTQGETGRLNEEVRALRRVVGRLESALKESHQVIATLSSELDKSYQSFQSSLRQKPHATSPHSYTHPQPSLRELPPQSHSNPHSHSHQQHQTTSVSNGLPKLPPTGPRAHKKPRLAMDANSKKSPSHFHASLPVHSAPSSNMTSRPPTQTPNQAQPHTSAQTQAQSRMHSPQVQIQPQSYPQQQAQAKHELSLSRSPRISPTETHSQGCMSMEVEDSRPRARSPHRGRHRGRGDRERGKERDREGDRERLRERDRDRVRSRSHSHSRFSKRNGAGGGGGGGAARRSRDFKHAYAGGDRTLAERMGLQRRV